MPNYVQSVDRNDSLNITLNKTFNMINNYVYLYHTDTLIALPVYPESIQDSIGSTFNSQTPLLRSAPIYSYANSGPRGFEIQIPLHRDMMNQINTTYCLLDIPDLAEEDYVDILVKQLQAAALPRYQGDKSVNPPLVAVRFGNSLFCKGIVNGGVGVTHSGPILSNDKYAMLTVSFRIEEVDPTNADTIILEGGYRGLRTTLESRVWKV